MSKGSIGSTEVCTLDDVQHVQIDIRINTSFKKYNLEEFNKVALQQIRAWCLEVLSETECIPLYVRKSAKAWVEEETSPNEISVVVSEVKK